jgi:hypothetical protein
MKTQKLTRPVLEASLPKYSVIQKLNFVLPIFDSIFPDEKNPDDLNQIVIFTAQYVSFRLSNPFNSLLSTYVNLFPATPATPATPASAHQHISTSSPASTSAHQQISTSSPTSAHQHISTSSPSIIQPAFYTIPLLIISHPKITRKMLIEFLPALSTVEKLNLILAIYDNICLNENDLNGLKKIISGYVRYAMKNRL